MTQYTRTVARRTTLPAWATTITVNDKLYEVGARWDDASLGLAPKYVWPSNLVSPFQVDSTNGNGLYAGTDGTFADFHDADAGSLFLEDLGAFGNMVFGGTGENVIIEQISQWDLNKDLPDWLMFQNPGYIFLDRPNTGGTAWNTRPSTSLVPTGVWYYGPNEYAALPTNRKIPWNAGTSSTGEAAWGAAWDHGFPVGRAGFILWEKQGPSWLPGNRPVAFRYFMPVYVPAWAAGNAQGSILVHGFEWCGPFSGQEGPPQGGVTPAQWYADYYAGTGNPKRWVHAMDVATKAWTVLGAIPDLPASAYELPRNKPGCFDPIAKKVHFFTCFSSGMRYFSIDLSGGIAGASVGAWSANVSLADGVGMTNNNIVACDVRYGANAGKTLVYFFDNATPRKLTCFDMQAGTAVAMSVSNLSSGQVNFAWDPSGNRVLMINRDGATSVKVSQFPIPTNYTTAGAYVVTNEVTMNASGISADGTLRATDHFGDRTHYLWKMGGIILLTQGQGKMLAFKPS